MKSEQTASVTMTSLRSDPVREDTALHDTQTLYDATRGIWRVGERRGRAELAMAVYQGMVKEVYVIGEWYPAGTTKTSKKIDWTVQRSWDVEVSWTRSA